MMKESWQIKELIELIRLRYPNWESFADEQFQLDERLNKVHGCKQAKELLAEDQYQILLESKNYLELDRRLKKVAQSSNLLWLAVPQTGDLSLLYWPNIDQKLLFTAINHLLHGIEPTTVRLAKFISLLEKEGWPIKWTFLTYYLFLLNPEDEIFIQPKTMQWFLRFMGGQDLWNGQPSALSYERMVTVSRQLYEQLRLYGALDMIDWQSFIRVCYEEGIKRIGGLDLVGQIDLDVPNVVEIEEEGMLMVGEEKPVWEVREVSRKTTDQLSAKLALSEEQLAQWLRVIKRKRQAVFYGPPGTGKSFAAKEIAAHLVAGGDGGVHLLQLHANYAYEEFVLGLRPINRNGQVAFELQEGRFLEICREVEKKEGYSVLILDEMNRAPLSRIFGELLYLLEYREEEMMLAGGRPFKIPEQLIILGTMNSADRSTAVVDFALRRRFAFFALPPNYRLLRQFHAAYRFDVSALIHWLERINNEIGDWHYGLGVSYFLLDTLEEELQDIWQTEIEPYLHEYFFDQPEKVAEFSWAELSKTI